LVAGIKDAVILQSDEAVVIIAEEEFDDKLPNGKWGEGRVWRWGMGEGQVGGGESGGAWGGGEVREGWGGEGGGVGSSEWEED
jgi:hypothetical protein